MQILVFQVKPSPLGLPDSARTGKNHKHLFSPNTCIQFSNLFSLNYNKVNQRFIIEILTLLSSRLAGSRDSIVVEFIRTNDKWNRKKREIRTDNVAIIL
jgi:hypothetical protein